MVQIMEKMKKHRLLSEIRAVISYVKPYKREIIIAIVALLFSSSAVLMLSQSVRSVIDSGISLGNEAMLTTAIGRTLLIVLVLGIATAVRFYFITYIGERVVADIRRKINNKILILSPSFFEVNKAGDLLAQLSGDTTTIYNIISSSLSVMMRNIVMLIGGIILMMSTSLKLTSIIGLIIPLLVMLVAIMGRTTRQLARKSQDKVAELTSVTDEIIHNIKTIQSYGQEKYEEEKFEGKLSELITVSLNRITSRSILTFALIVGVFSTVGIVLWVGSRNVIEGSITPGQLSSFIFLTIICGASLVALSETINNIQKASGVSERISEFLMKIPEVKNCHNPLIIKDIVNQPTIEFKNVTFFYPSKPELPILNNISIEFSGGKTTAIVGESGAGKSTIVQLILRFYNVAAGEILYSGIDISKIDLHSLRREFAYVGQDPAIFSTSIYENIAYSKPNATLEEVREAAIAAAAVEFIEELPKGFDTFVGEKGVRLSGGQKQRIAIARAILKNPKVLLLDEATSSLDNNNELLVQQGLQNLMKDRTCIIVAHRLSTIKNADKIIVVKDGILHEEGKHNDLIALDGYYSKLYKTGLYKE
jgi:ATP-binding cassette subfamily B protein